MWFALGPQMDSLASASYAMPYKIIQVTLRESRYKIQDSMLLPPCRHYCLVLGFTLDSSTMDAAVKPMCLSHFYFHYVVVVMLPSPCCCSCVQPLWVFSLLFREERQEQTSGPLQGLKVHTTEIDRIRKDDMKNLMRMKKLILVLDLDHTLLNSTRFADITSEEGHLLSQMDSTQGDPKRSLFELNSMHLLTKLRPYVHTFLSEASSIYDMHIYTMGERSYAVEIAKILDPEQVYFNSKIICQSDCTQRHKKGLDVVLGAESTVVILDDTETVWQRHRENLISMERYHYFASSSHQFNSSQESLLLAKKDESETDGILSSILTVLKRVHQMFFDPVPDTDLTNRDVRLVLRNVRQEILRGCKVVFSRLFPSESRAEDQRIWKMCEQLGATCYTEVGPSITHVVSTDKGTQKARWAVQNEKFLVSLGWVEGAYYLWRRMPEKDYPITSPKK